MRVPEEINRRIVDHTADINLTYSTIARDYLLREGLAPDTVIKTGSPMFEVLTYYRQGIEESDVLTRLQLEAGRFFVVSAHREENVDSEKNFGKLVGVLNRIAEHYGYPVIVSTHPRTQKRVDAMGVVFHPLVRLLKPLGFKDYNKLQMMAKAVLWPPPSVPSSVIPPASKITAMVSVLPGRLAHPTACRASLIS